MSGNIDRGSVCNVTYKVKALGAPEKTGSFTAPFFLLLILTIGLQISDFVYGYINTIVNPNRLKPLFILCREFNNE